MITIIITCMGINQDGKCLSINWKMFKFLTSFLFFCIPSTFSNAIAGVLKFKRFFDTTQKT